MDGESNVNEVLDQTQIAKMMDQLIDSSLINWGEIHLESDGCWSMEKAYPIFVTNCDSNGKIDFQIGYDIGGIVCRFNNVGVKSIKIYPIESEPPSWVKEFPSLKYQIIRVEIETDAVCDQMVFDGSEWEKVTDYHITISVNLSPCNPRAVYCSSLLYGYFSSYVK